LLAPFLNIMLRHIDIMHKNATFIKRFYMKENSACETGGVSFTP